MPSRSLHRRLDRLSADDPPPRLIVQNVGPDGTPRLSDEEVEQRAADLRAAGYEPRLIIVQTVNAPTPGPEGAPSGRVAS